MLRVQEVATDMYVSVESERATDIRVTDTSNGTSTDTYVSVKEDKSLSLNLYEEINTLYKRKIFFFFFKSNNPACGLDHGRDSGAS